MPSMAKGQKSLRSDSGSLCRPCGCAEGLPVLRPTGSLKRWSIVPAVSALDANQGLAPLAPGLETLSLMACG